MFCDASISSVVSKMLLSVISSDMDYLINSPVYSSMNLIKLSSEKKIDSSLVNLWELEHSSLL